MSCIFPLVLGEPFQVMGDKGGKWGRRGRAGVPGGETWWGEAGGGDLE